MAIEDLLTQPPDQRPGELRNARRQGRIIIDPPYSDEELDELLGNVSIDLELGGKIRIHGNPHEHPVNYDGYLNAPIVDLTIPETIAQIEETDRLYELGDDEAYVLPPGGLVKAHTSRYFLIPYNLMGLVTGRSSVGRWGVTTTVDAPKIDPGFSGRIVLELANLGSYGFSLRKGMLISQMMFFTVEGEIGEPYDETGDFMTKFERQEGVHHAVSPRPWPGSQQRRVIRTGITLKDE